jgi:hypothetical protein
LKKAGQQKVVVAKQILEDPNYMRSLFSESEIKFSHFKRALLRDGLFWIIKGSEHLFGAHGNLAKSDQFKKKPPVLPQAPADRISNFAELQFRRTGALDKIRRQKMVHPLKTSDRVRQRPTSLEKEESVKMLDFKSFLQDVVQSGTISKNDAKLTRQKPSSGHQPAPQSVVLPLRLLGCQTARKPRAPSVFKPCSRMSSLAEQSVVRDRLLEQRIEQRVIRLKKLRLDQAAAKAQHGKRLKEKPRKVDIGFDLFYHS